MGARVRFALIIGSALLAGHAMAAPSDGAGSGSDIEMGPDQPDAGSGSDVAKPDEPAQPVQPVKDPKVAKKWLTAAQQLVARGDQLTRAGKLPDAKAQYENAITAYQHAIDAGDDVAVYYALAIIEDKVGSIAPAYKHLKLVIDPKSGAKPDVIKKARAKLDEISGKLGTVTLTVKPDGTAISLAGEQIGEAPLSEPLVLAPGTYTLSFAAVGYQPKDAEIRVEAGSESERKIELEPVPVVVKTHPIDIEPATPEEPPGPKWLPAYVGAAATGGLLVIGTVTGILAIHQHGIYVNPKTAKLDREDAQSNGKTLAHVTDACLLGMVGAAAFTSYWYFYKVRPVLAKRADEHPSAKLELAPWVEPTAGGLVVGGEF